MNKLVYQFDEPRVGDIVMLWYPEDPSKAFVKRIVAQSGDVIRSVAGRVFVNEAPEPNYQIPDEFKIARYLGAARREARLLLCDGGPSEQQLGQPHLG